MSPTAIKPETNRQLESRIGKYKRFINGILGVVAGVVFWFLARHQSLDPVLGRYSLPYLLVMVGYAIGVMVFVIWIWVRGVKAQILILVNILLIVSLMVLIEAAGQVYASLHPTYIALFLEPDATLGWRHVPKFRWPVSSGCWFPREFSNVIETNDDGLRDRPRSIQKPGNTIRIALLGDSLVEAVQVPLEKTAGGLLERRMNGEAPHRARVRCEVLNFGVSNYGVGQFYLCWQEQTRKYLPDIVFVLVAGFHMHRTMRSGEQSVLNHGPGTVLRIRPTFQILHNDLVWEKPRDYEGFKEAQQAIIENKFGGNRICAAPKSGWYLGYLKRRLFSLSGLLVGFQQSRWAAGTPRAQAALWPPFDDNSLKVNLRILAQMGRECQKSGARFVLVDIHAYAHQYDLSYREIDPRSKTLPETLRSLCASEHFGYIGLSDALLDANRKGVSTQWLNDGHLNEQGNRIFADCMYDWILRQAMEATQPRLSMVTDLSGRVIPLGGLYP